MSNQLLQQIQQEMNREAMFEEKINKCLKQYLKINKQFYQVNQIKDCHAVLIFKKEFPLKVDLRIYNPKNPIDEMFFFFFLYFILFKIQK